MGLFRNWQFFHIFILAKKRQENVFNDIIKRENTFLDNKNNKLIKSKNCYFFKGVSPWVFQKLAIFHIFI